MRARGILPGVLAAPAALIWLATLPSAPRADDRDDPAARARTILAEVAHSAASAAPSALDLRLLAKPMAAASFALVRADNLRLAKDEAHAHLAADLALTWAEVARAEAQSMALEAQSRDDENALLTLEPQARDVRAKLEEAVARRAELKAKLAALEAKQKEAAQAAIERATRPRAASSSAHAPTAPARLKAQAGGAR